MDRLVGTAAGDRLKGRGGNDRLNGGKGERDRVIADEKDKVRGCERVTRR